MFAMHFQRFWSMNYGECARLSELSFSCSGLARNAELRCWGIDTGAGQLTNRPCQEADIYAGPEPKRAISLPVWATGHAPRARHFRHNKEAIMRLLEALSPLSVTNSLKHTTSKPVNVSINQKSASRSISPAQS